VQEAGEEYIVGAFHTIEEVGYFGGSKSPTNRIPARPNAFERVCRTLRLGVVGDG
jgi:hypothetical protein